MLGDDGSVRQHFDCGRCPALILDRRQLIRLSGVSALALGIPFAPPGRAAETFHPQAGPMPSSPLAATAPADHTLRIGTSLVELGPDTTISTKTYNGQFPGPLLRMTEGKPVVVDIHNDTDTPEQLHWHGQFVPA